MKIEDRSDQIRHIINELLTEWLVHPDMRFGQLIENIMDGDGCIWNIEDTDTLERIENYDHSRRYRC